MKPYVHDIMRPLQWQRNKAPRLHSLMRQKNDWYVHFHTEFWQRWYSNTFNLITADAFGLLVWCFILDVPSQAFVLFPGDVFWAYGDKRQNYHSNPPQPIPPDPSPYPPPPTLTAGGNFYGGDDTTILTPEEAKRALRMKYYALISNGTITSMNAALKDVFGQGNAWIEDGQNMTITYHFGPGVVSATFVNAVTKYQMLPSVAGVKTNIVYS